MPPIVIAFHYKNLDAMGGMICGYAGAKREPISDGRHNTRYRAAAPGREKVFLTTLRPSECAGLIGVNCSVHTDP